MDEIGNCLLFVCVLVGWLQVYGVEFYLFIEVQVIEVVGGQVSGLCIFIGILCVDVYVVVCVSVLVLMLKFLGLDLLIYLVKGYVIMVLVVDFRSVLCSGVMDEYYKVVIICMGNYICVVGMVEIGSWDMWVILCDCVIVLKLLKNFYLQGVDLVKVEYWVGLCFMILDGVLFIGVICYVNLWFNVGYGFNGWIMVCGFLVIIVDKILGVVSVIESVDFELQCMF